MTIRRGNFEIVCNKCNEVEDLETTDFDEAVEAADLFMDNENWTTIRVGGRNEKATYQHFCGTCRTG